MEDLSAFSARPRLAALLDHFAEIADTRQSWKVMYPLREVLFLVVCGTIASGDDYDDIVDWGEAHLAFLRGFAEFHFGIPCTDWLRCIMNRIDPKLFMDCFSSWVAACWPDRVRFKVMRLCCRIEGGLAYGGGETERRGVFGNS